MQRDPKTTPEAEAVAESIEEAVRRLCELPRAPKALKMSRATWDAVRARYRGRARGEHEDVVMYGAQLGVAVQIDDSIPFGEHREVWGEEEPRGQ